MALEGKYDAAGFGQHLHEHAPARGGGFVGQLEIMAPVVGGFAVGEDAEGNRRAGIHGQRLETVEVLANPLGVEPGVFTGDFEYPGVKAAHHADQLTNLLPVGEAAGDRLAVGCLMVAGARGGKADRTGQDRVAHFALHRFQIVGRGLISEGPLAHHVGAQRGMPHVGGVVDSFGRAVDRVEVLGESLPRPFDAGLHRLGGDVLGALQVAHHQQLVLFGAWGQRKAAVTHHHRGHAMPA